MPTASGSRRPTTSKSTKPPVPKSNDVDDLTKKLASKLTIADPKGKQKATVKQTPEEKRNDSMRLINSNSQNFSSLLQSGWKASEIKKPADPKLQSVASVKAQAVAIRGALQLLRELSPGDVDVERASLSSAGKLIQLDLSDCALDLLVDIRDALLSLYPHDPQPTTKSKSTKAAAEKVQNVFWLPLPLEEIEPSLVKLISQYLIHSLTALSNSISSANAEQIAIFAASLNKYPSLSAWINASPALPKDHVDSVSTRAYTVLTKSSAANKEASSQTTFDIRIHSLRCLLHASSSVLKADTFWDQATKFGATFIKGNRETEKALSQSIISAFSQLVDDAEGRSDKETFLSGRGFIKFCEYWMSFGKTIGDLKTLNRVSSLMDGISSSSSTPMDVDTNPVDENLNAAQICSTLTETGAVIENVLSDPTATSRDDLQKQISEAHAALGRSARVLTSVASEVDTESQKTRAKVSRAVERLRRSCLKLLDTQDTGIVSLAESLIHQIADALELAVSQAGNEDLRTSLLDTFFVLSRATLQVLNPDTYVPAYDILARANKVATSQHCSAESRPNYLRCLSAAFYSLGGNLYQAARHGAAARFIQDACTAGSEALSLWRQSQETVEASSTPEAWTQLHEQLHKRWELLGVCYSKISDRQRSCDSFINSIQAYPFSSQPFASMLLNVSPQSLFEGKHQQIGAIIDRVTYMGVSDLFKPADQISLKDTMQYLCDADPQFGQVIIGAILERQIDGLEASAWKEDVKKLVNQILEDALEIYGDRWPIRKARILLRCLEFSYYTKTKSEWNPEELLAQTQVLLSRTDFGEDAQASHFKLQYLASAHLWMMLHAHRGESLQQPMLVVKHAEEACKILRSLLSPPSSPATPQAKKVAKVSPVKAAPKGRPVRKPRKPPVTPKLRKTLVPASPSVAHKITPRASLGGSTKPIVPFDQFHRLTGLLQMATQLLGLLGHVVTKVHLLIVTRRMMERNGDSSSDDYIRISVDLAHEYVKLGRMEKASTVYSHTLPVVRSSAISVETRVFYFLRFAESLAMVGNFLQSSTMYCEAQSISEAVTAEDKTMTTAVRIRTRVGSLERAAMAANTFAMIQYYNDDPTTSLSALLQSLRLYNRAVETLSRLNPTPVARQETEETDPFAEEPKDSAKPQSAQKTSPHKVPSNGLEWRISEGLMTILFALAQAYFVRGSAREAEYFAQQAQDLAEAMNTPAMVSRALARKGEIYLHLGRLDEGYQCLVKAADLVSGLSALDAADIRRLHGDYSLKNLKSQDAQQLYEEAMNILEELQKSFSALDGVSPKARKSDIRSPRTSKIAPENDTLLPSLLAAVLRQHIWLLRDEDAGEESKLLMNRFLALPASAETKAEENGLMAKLALHEAYSRFRADMFLSSLAESTIALPMVMTNEKGPAAAPGTQEISTALTNAEKLFWSDLALIARRGQVSQVREAAVSLALIRAFQTSLGKAGLDGAVLAARLLDASTTITLRREMLEAIQSKFPDYLDHDDMQWPLITSNGSPLPPPKRKSRSKVARTMSAEGDEVNFDDPSYKGYWETIAERYRSYTLDSKALSTSDVDKLPHNWTVVNISVTEDKSTLFISRQRAHRQPLIFCVPMKGRRESEDDEHLTFDDAINEFKEIIRLSDEATRGAVHVNKNDKQARSNWWAERSALDDRLRLLLENIEFCWLGAFKTILCEPMDNAEEALTSFRVRLEGVFRRSLASLDKKQLNRVNLDESLIECLSTLSPKCRDEEIEDLIYFVLDLYQFHGIPVAIAEVDIDQLVVDLRTMLEEHANVTQGQVSPLADHHTFLVLDKNVEGIPWESTPVLRGKSVSRIPNMDFLLDRLELAKRRQPVIDGSGAVVNCAVVDPRKTYYVLNPSGDLKATEGRFSEWLTKMKGVGWSGVTGKTPSEQQLLDALSKQDLVLYFGHGGGEQYVRSHKIRHLQKCAATMLWGCSSGAMKEMGEFDRVGIPYNYMLAGCPTLVVNIWDVTDRDIDRFAQSVFDKLKITKERVGKWTSDAEDEKVSVVTAVAQSRDACKLKYLTGAAPVVYGIPFYL